MSYVYINRLNMPYSFLNPIWASLLSTPVPNPSSRNFTCTNLTKLKITMSYAYTKSLNMPYPSSIQSRVSFLSTPVQNPYPRNFTCINLAKLKITMSYAYTDSPYSAYMCRKSPWPQFKCFKQLFETNRPLLWWKVHIDQKGKTAITNNGKKKKKKTSHLSFGIFSYSVPCLTWGRQIPIWKYLNFSGFSESSGRENNEIVQRNNKTEFIKVLY